MNSKPSDSSTETMTFTAPIPGRDVFSSCNPDDLDKDGKSFNPNLCAKAKKFIEILIGRVLAASPELSRTHSIKLTVLDESVELSIRSRPPETIRVVTAEDERLKQKYPFPTKEAANAEIENSVPHKEGLSKSAVYTVLGEESDVIKFCKSIGKVYVLTKDQPKDAKLIRFRVFGSNKPGFVKTKKNKDV